MAATHVVPRLKDDPERWVAAINAAIAARGYRLVVPAADAELLALSARRAEIDALIPYPSHEVVLAAIDKLSLAEAARAAGLRAPRTIEASDVLIEESRFPALVKARLHVAAPKGRSAGRVEATLAADAAEALDAAQRIRDAGGVPVLQEVIAGKLLACTVVVAPGGKLVAVVTQLATRTWPRDAGPSTRACTVEPDPADLAGIARLMDAIGWSGLAQLQFIRDEAGDDHLIDFNARFYGSLALAVAAGANLPAIWASTALSGPREQPASAPATGDLEPTAPRARIGTRYQWLEGDLRAAVMGEGGSGGAILECLSFSRGATHPIWDRRDLAPAIRSVLRLTARVPRFLFRLATPGSR